MICYLNGLIIKLTIFFTFHVPFKVKLSNEEGIWIDKDQLQSYITEFTKTPSYMVNHLVETSLGFNNLKDFSLRGKPPFKSVPDNLVKAICSKY